jgi:hypothetical protein
MAKDRNMAVNIITVITHIFLSDMFVSSKKKKEQYPFVTSRCVVYSHQSCFSYTFTSASMLHIYKGRVRLSFCTENASRTEEAAATTP